MTWLLGAVLPLRIRNQHCHEPLGVEGRLLRHMNIAVRTPLAPGLLKYRPEVRMASNVSREALKGLVERELSPLRKFQTINGGPPSRAGSDGR